MNHSEPKRRTSWIWYLVSVLLLVTLGPYIINFGKPERIGERVAGTYSGGLVQSAWKNGHDYWLTDDANGSVIHMRPMMGGAERPIVQEDPRFQIPYGGMAVTDEGVIYGLIKRPKPDPVFTRRRMTPWNANSPHFYEDYLYFSIGEERRGLWASLMDDNTVPAQTVSVLFRAPLPK